MHWKFNFGKLLFANIYSHHRYLVPIIAACISYVLWTHFQRDFCISVQKSLPTRHNSVRMGQTLAWKTNLAECKLNHRKWYMFTFLCQYLILTYAVHIQTNFDLVQKYWYFVINGVFLASKTSDYSELIGSIAYEDHETSLYTSS